jgi:hypothetical protein
VIFSFWQDPVDADIKGMPEYLRQVQETWDKYIGDNSRILISHYNWDEYIGDLIPLSEKIKTFPLAIQSDIASAALLYKYGGVFMDIDTIMVNESVKGFLFTEDDYFTAFGMPELFSMHVAIIKCKKNHDVVKRWLDDIILSLELGVDQQRPTQYANFILERLWRDKQYTHLFNILDRRVTGNVPEAKINYIKTEQRRNYLDYWFGALAPESFLSLRDRCSHGLISLHNSWTPRDILRKNIDALIDDRSFLVLFLNYIIADD